MATMEERLAALEEKVQKLTTPPDDYYMSRWTGEQIDNAVAKINSADGLVTAFNGRSGAVLPQAGDYTAEMVGAASLGADGKIPESQLPQLTSNVTLYVDASTGSDSNPGTQSEPFKTIQAAVNSTPNDLNGYFVQLKLAPGNYNEAVSIHGKVGGTFRIQGDTENKGLYVVNKIWAQYCTRVEIVGVTANTVYAESVHFFDVEFCAIENPTENYGMALQKGTTATLFLVSFTGCEYALAITSGSTAFAGACSGSGNKIGISINANDGFPGLVLLNSCNFGATTEFQKGYGSIVFKDGVVV